MPRFIVVRHILVGIFFLLPVLLFSQELTDLFKLEVEKNDELRIQVNKKIQQQILNHSPDELTLSFPFWDNQVKSLSLTKFSFLTPSSLNELTKAASNKNHSVTSIDYVGEIDKVANTFVVLSFSKNEIKGFFSIAGKIYHLLQPATSLPQSYLLLEEPQPDNSLNFKCHLGNPINDQQKARPSSSFEKGVTVSLECDYAFLQNMGSAIKVEEVVVDIWRIVAALFSRDGIPLTVADIKILQQPDRYRSMDAQTAKEHFQKKKDGNFKGDIAVLLSNLLQNKMAQKGGAANLGGICNKPQAVAYCNINTSYQELPFYSWAIYCIAHEVGHLLGAHHTHSCLWSNGPLDNCWCSEGDCETGPSPSSTGGTIMSYCHLNPAFNSNCEDLSNSNPGVDLSLGFGEQPVTIMKQHITTCLRGPTTATTHHATQGDIQLYPIPAQNQLTIALPNQNKQVTIQVINLSGMEVFKKQYNNTQLIQLDISNWSMGLYPIYLQTLNGNYWSKVIIGQ